MSSLSLTYNAVIVAVFGTVTAAAVVAFVVFIIVVVLAAVVVDVVAAVVVVVVVVVAAVAITVELSFSFRRMLNACDRCDSAE